MNLRRSLAGAALAAVIAPGLAMAAPVLLPAPSSAHYEAGSLPLGGAFQPRWAGARSPLLDRAVARFQADVGRLTGAPWPPAPGASLIIDCKAALGPARKAGTDESYRLVIAPTSVTLTAATDLGVLRGLASLRQLIDTSGAAPSLPLAAIDDAPRFAWRGVMIDTARHFMSLPTLKRQIDAMEAVKLNVLHLHLSDDQGFRVESRLYPKLQAIASHGQFYTQDQIRDLVAYAADRGVRIVPEIDVPGHTTAILTAYPEFAVAPPDPTAPLAGLTLDPASPAARRFVDRLFAEMAGLFPDADFHTGGDEVAVGAWAKAADVQAFMQAHGLKTQAEMEAVFHRQTRAALKADSKTMIGWEEIAAAGLPADVIVQAWRDSNSTAAAVASGHSTIVSAGYYLDLLTPAAQHYAIDPFDLEADGFTPEEGAKAKAFSPLAAAVVGPLVLKPLPPLTPAQQKLVLGGEGALWAETVDDEILDARLWPRAAALAERFWSPADVRDAPDMYRRLAVTQDELRRLGLEDQANQARMAERLAPGQAEPVLTLLSITEPVRHFGHNHMMLAMVRGNLHPPAQALNSLADAAPADSLDARRFEAEATRFAGGDRSGAAALKAELQTWRDNDARFAAVAAGHPQLEAAKPVSADIAVLCQAALDAIDAVQSGKPLPPDVLAKARAAIAKAERQEAASARPIFTFINPQPPADLIIAITAGVKTLVEAAG